VIKKLLSQREIFGHDRFLLQISVGTLPHPKVLSAIELFGMEVVPVVRREMGKARSTQETLPMDTIGIHAG